MTAPTARAARPASGTDDGSRLAATVLCLDGRRYTWRADGLGSDHDVTAWLDGDHDVYAALWWAELDRLHAAHG